MAKLGKRGYPALYLKGSNAWYTGYAHDWKMEDKVDVSDRHEIRELKLQYTGFSRGRSAANIEMVDQGGNKFLMSMSGFDLLMKIVDAPASVKRAEKLGGYDIIYIVNERRAAEHTTICLVISHLRENWKLKD